MDILRFRPFLDYQLLLCSCFRTSVRKFRHTFCSVTIICDHMAVHCRRRKSKLDNLYTHCASTGGFMIILKFPDKWFFHKGLHIYVIHDQEQSFFVLMFL